MCLLSAVVFAERRHSEWGSEFQDHTAVLLFQPRIPTDGLSPDVAGNDGPSVPADPRFQSSDAHSLEFGRSQDFDDLCRQNRNGDRGFS